MIFNSHFVAWAIVIGIANLAHGDSSFIFPPNSSVTNFTANVPIVAKIGTIHFEDDMIVEYTLPDTVETVWLSQDCYGKLSDTNGSYEAQENSSGDSYSQAGVFENTGKLFWNLGDGNDEEGGFSNVTYCMFTLFDYTLRGCSWGPFGLTSWDQANSEDEPLLYSEMFRILPPNSSSTEQTTITNTAKTANQTPASVIATPTNVTCPVSGIPPTPTSSPVAQMEMYPPLASGLTFPTWVYTPPYDDED